MRKSCRDSRVR